MVDHSKGNLREAKNRTAFILGIHRRSGTNFLSRLLHEHPDCRGIGPIGEDYLLQHTDVLRKYVENVKGSWNPDWRIHSIRNGHESLYRSLGDAVLQWLQAQSLIHDLQEQQGDLTQHDNGGGGVVVTKTPSVDGLPNFFVFFPQAYLILLIRDGRAVVESGMRSFGWCFEIACREWRRAARNILAFDGLSSCPDQVRLVRYEQLVQDTQSELMDIFAFLGLESTRYDFAASGSLGVIGSSELARNEEKVHWNAVPMQDDFKPLRRFDHWTVSMHQRFNWIAGREMHLLGYAVETTPPLGIMTRLYYRVLDAFWCVHGFLAVVNITIRQLSMRTWHFLKAAR